MLERQHSTQPAFSQDFISAVLIRLKGDSPKDSLSTQTSLDIIRSLENKILSKVDPVKKLEVEQVLRELFAHYIGIVENSKKVEDTLLPQIIIFLEDLDRKMDRRLGKN